MAIGYGLRAIGSWLLVALAVRLGLTARAIADALHAYPTFCEGVFWTAWELAKPHAVGYEATAALRRRGGTWTRWTRVSGWQGDGVMG